jgi:NAD(P)-dependent dehydrogenase (short-subunit alcohol dehydrogenase family)
MPVELTEKKGASRDEFNPVDAPPRNERVSGEHEARPSVGPPPDQRPSRRRLLLIGALGILVLAIVCIFGIPWILESLNSVSTDDAYVHGHVTFVAPRVAGQISPVLVDDNNCVHKGELLAELDKEPFPDAVAFYGGLPSLWASIHVAGGFAFAPLTDTSAELLRRLIDDNLVSCFLCCREAVAAMRRGKVDGRPGGRIVNVAARQALEPREGAKMSADTAAKPGVAALSAALGEELAGEGILVNALAPSIMDTPTNRRDMPKANFDAWPKVEEVAATILFLASPENKVTRGGVVPVFGASSQSRPSQLSAMTTS